MAKTIAKSFFIFLFLALSAYGQQQDRVAIINTEDDRDSIGFSDLSHLTNRLRETAVKILPKSRYGIMTTESIVAFFGSMENTRKACNESSCLVEIGRKVSADYVAQAHINRFGSQLSINFDLYNTKSGTLIDSFTGHSEDIFGLLAVIDEKAPDLFRQMPGASGDISPVPELEKPSKTSFWVAIGLDVLGVAIISYAVYENSEMTKYKNKYLESGHTQSYYDDSYKKAENIRSSRNMFYVIGGAVLASGIGVHIWF